MSTLLRDIQQEASSRDVDVEALLRKCKVLARRLHSESFEQWVDRELNGYPKDVEVPPYRMVSQLTYASFTNGYQTIPEYPIAPALIEKKWRNIFERIPFREGVAAAKTLSANGGMIDRSELKFVVKGRVVDLPCYRLWSKIPPTEMTRILTAVVSRVLDFTMDIEVENPEAGEARVSDVPVAPEKVSQLVTNHFYGSVGNVAQNSTAFNQTASINVSDVRAVVDEIEKHIGDLNSDPDVRERVETQIATIQAQLAADEPDPSIIREAGRTLRAILEGIAAGAIASPTVWHGIKETLAALF